MSGRRIYSSDAVIVIHMGSWSLCPTEVIFDPVLISHGPVCHARTPTGEQKVEGVNDRAVSCASLDLALGWQCPVRLGATGCLLVVTEFVPF
jgi:hypothetical protein